jgi:inner membrane protein
MWFAAGLVFFALELAVPGITLLFFGVGSIVTACVLFFYPLHIFWQLCLFLLTSIATLFVFRSKIRSKLFLGKDFFYNSPSPLQPEIISFEVDVIESIIPPHLGRVLLHGAPWQASATREIEKGARVKIIRREGLVLFVEPHDPRPKTQSDQERRTGYPHSQ